MFVFFFLSSFLIESRALISLWSRNARYFLYLAAVSEYILNVSLLSFKSTFFSESNMAFLSCSGLVSKFSFLPSTKLTCFLSLITMAFFIISLYPVNLSATYWYYSFLTLNFLTLVLISPVYPILLYGSFSNWEIYCPTWCLINFMLKELATCFSNDF